MQLTDCFPMMTPNRVLWMTLLALLALCVLAATPAYAGTDYYRLLEVDRSADENDIKKAYRRLVRKLHPDKYTGNDKAAAEKKFMEVNRAYEVLTDPQQRQVYDQYGEEGLSQQQQQGGGGGHPGDGFFRTFFQQGGPFGGGGQQFFFNMGGPGGHQQFFRHGGQQHHHHQQHHGHHHHHQQQQHHHHHHQHHHHQQHQQQEDVYRFPWDDARDERADRMFFKFF